jgi:DNA repair protein RadD
VAIELRPYQHQAIEQIRAAYRSGKRAPLFVLPTGGGKTVCFSYMAAAARDKGLRVTILAHRAELLDQISRTLQAFGVKHGMIAPGRLADRRQPVQVASVFALVRRLDRYQPADFIICDEAHHAVPGSTWGTVFDAYPKALRLGVSATPIRLSGEGLGGMFDCMVQGPTMRELIELGSLSRYRLFVPADSVDLRGLHSRGGDFVRNELAGAVDKPKITGSALAHYQKHASGKRAVAFCVSVEHANHVAEQFRADGIPAMSIDGGMDSVLRQSILDGFSAGRTLVLTSCDLISEGFDVPAIEAAILLRPTQSLGLYLQQVGRALRAFEGKREAIILDHAGNVARHGLPDAAREWTLDSTKDGKTAGKNKEMPVKQCPKCFSTVSAVATHCICGHVFQAQAREIEHVDGELSEVDLSSQAAQEQRERIQKRVEQGSAKDREALIALGRKRGVKNPEGWAAHVLRGRAARDERMAQVRSQYEDAVCRSLS